VGGMGSVYRVRDLELEEVVALKVLRRDLNLTSDLLDGFRLEVKLARRVTHRNVARVFDIGEHEGERFLTMELIDGEPLSATLARGGPIAILRGMEIAAGIAAGLAGAPARLVPAPPDPREKRPSLPIPHAEFVMRCMARRREDRYPSAQHVIAEIERLAQPPPGLRRTPSSSTLQDALAPTSREPTQ